MPPFGNLQTIGNDENVFTVTFDETRLDFHGQPPWVTTIPVFRVGFKTISVRCNIVRVKRNGPSLALRGRFQSGLRVSVVSASCPESSGHPAESDLAPKWV